MRHVGVVGAGVAGAATAYALRDADVEVTLLESGGAAGGRAGTRERDDCRYDHGAAYLKADDDRVVELVTETLQTDGLHELTPPVWTFDGDGSVTERESTDRKWTFESGLSALTERLVAESDATVAYDVTVESADRELDGRWWLHGADDDRRGPFDAVVCTPPGPRTADLLRGTELDAELRETVVAACESVSFRAIRTVALHYPFALDRSFYALVNADGAHDVRWVARESCKPGHVPEGEELLLVHLPGEGDSTDETAAVDRATEAAASLLDDSDLRDPDWTDTAEWSLALPNGGVDEDVRSRAADAGLHLAGDWVVGEARLHAALSSGLELGESLATR